MQHLLSFSQTTIDAMLLDIKIIKFHSKLLLKKVARLVKKKNISQSKLVFTLWLDAMAPPKNNLILDCIVFVRILFPTLKMASRMQLYWCQKFSSSIPVHTWKISWVERLIYFFYRSWIGWTKEKLRLWRNIDYNFFRRSAVWSDVPFAVYFFRSELK